MPLVIFAGFVVCWALWLAGWRPGRLAGWLAAWPAAGSLAGGLAGLAGWWLVGWHYWAKVCSVATIAVFAFVGLCPSSGLHILPIKKIGMCMWRRRRTILHRRRHLVKQAWEYVPSPRIWRMGRGEGRVGVSAVRPTPECPTERDGLNMALALRGPKVALYDTVHTDWGNY